MSPPSRAWKPILRDAALSAEQLFDAIDQPLDRERFNQVFDVVLSQEERDFCVGGKACDENETIGQRWTHFLRLEIKLITLQPRHLQIADHRVVLVRFDLEERCFSVKRDINQKILVRQDPLQSRGELLVVVDHQDSLEVETVNVRLKFLPMRVRFHRGAGLIEQPWCQIRASGRKGEVRETRDIRVIREVPGFRLPDPSTFRDDKSRCYRV